MATRQVRLETPEQIHEKLRPHHGKEINIVLRNRTVLYGRLDRVEPATLHFVNMRNEKVALSLSDISEVYLDFVA